MSDPPTGDWVKGRISTAASFGGCDAREGRDDEEGGERVAASDRCGGARHDDSLEFERFAGHRRRRRSGRRRERSGFPPPRRTRHGEEAQLSLARRDLFAWQGGGDLYA